MGKAKREAKRAAKKQQRKASAEERQAAIEAERIAVASARRRAIIQLVGTPIVTALLAAGAYWGMEIKALAGITVVAGVVVLVAFALARLGSSVKPRGSRGAGNINFGN